MRILAVTGGLATGKSTVTAILGALGAPTLSADALAHELLRPGTRAAREVLAAFPDCASLDQEGALDRRALGRTIFADNGARARLEALTHPPIIAALQEAAAQWRREAGGCAALEIPLLFEAGLEAIADRIVVVLCSPDQQIERVLARGSASEAEARRQISAQWPLEEKKQRADFVIDTGISLAETQRQTKALWENVCQ